MWTVLRLYVGHPCTAASPGSWPSTNRVLLLHKLFVVMAAFKIFHLKSILNRPFLNILKKVETYNLSESRNGTNYERNRPDCRCQKNKSILSEGGQKNKHTHPKLDFVSTSHTILFSTRRKEKWRSVRSNRNDHLEQSKKMIKNSYLSPLPEFYGALQKGAPCVRHFTTCTNHNPLSRAP